MRNALQQRRRKRSRKRREQPHLCLGEGSYGRRPARGVVRDATRQAPTQMLARSPGRAGLVGQGPGEGRDVGPGQGSEPASREGGPAIGGVVD